MVTLDEKEVESDFRIHGSRTFCADLKYAADHVVPRLRIDVVILDVVHVTHYVGPQVVVGVDDRAFGIEDRLLDLTQPGGLIGMEDIHVGFLMGIVPTGSSGSAACPGPP